MNRSILVLISEVSENFSSELKIFASTSITVSLCHSHYSGRQKSRRNMSLYVKDIFIRISK